MRVLVYPHSMEIGGSQLNAIEIAGALRDRGHEVVVYSDPGVLVDRLPAMGLEHVPRLPTRRVGAPAVRRLRELLRSRRIDVVHAWEWPPILEAFFATPGGSGAASVGSIMSMEVAHFLPASVPLTVGTRGLLDRGRAERRGVIELLEPPVDLSANRPGEHAATFRAAYPSAEGRLQVVVVSRLAHELKLEGILTAVRAMARVNEGRDVRLVIVGDGPAAATVQAEAETVNRALGREVVLLTGALSDPRPAYDASDVCLAMGGSALRAMAFGKPLIVQGEGGFFRQLTPLSAPQFLEQGWFGLDSISAEQAVDRLAWELAGFLDDAGRRREMGEYGRRLVESRYSLDHAVDGLEALYAFARSASVSDAERRRDVAASGLGFVAHQLRRRVNRARGVRVSDDFNAVKQVAQQAGAAR